MSTFKSKNWVLFILLVLFFLPGLCAIWFYLNPQLLNHDLVNKGQLMRPPVLVKALDQSKTWQLVYVPEGQCARPCLQALSQLAKVRLSLGRHLYGLSLNLLMMPGVKAPEERQLNEMDIKMITLKERKNTLSPYRVWVVDPKGYVVMVYRDESHPKDIFSDLQHFSPLWG
jgi:hypothetical protein